MASSHTNSPTTGDLAVWRLFRAFGPTPEHPQYMPSGRVFRRLQGFSRA